MTKPKPDAMTQTQAADYLGIKPPSVSYHLDTGTLTVVLVDGVRRVGRESIERLKRYRDLVRRAKYPLPHGRAK